MLRRIFNKLFLPLGFSKCYIEYLINCFLPLGFSKMLYRIFNKFFFTFTLFKMLFRIFNKLFLYNLWCCYDYGRGNILRNVKYNHFFHACAQKYKSLFIKFTKYLQNSSLQNKISE